MSAWEFLTDYGTHPGSLRVIASEKLVERNGHEAEVRIRFGARMAMISLGADFLMKVREKPSKRIDFTLYEKSAERFQGFWGVHPLSTRECAVSIGLAGDIRTLGWPARALLDRYPALESGVLSAVVSSVLTDIETHFNGRKSHR